MKPHLYKDTSQESDFKEYTSPFIINRREFLKIFGSGIFVLLAFNNPKILLAKSDDKKASNLFDGDVNALLRIGEDGRVTCFTGKIEMGQGVMTSLAQMLADELDVPLKHVDMVMGDTNLCPYDRGTWGSLTTPVFGPQLRAGGAEAKNILLHLAAKKLNLPVEKLAVKDGIVFDRSNKAARISYAQLAKGERIERPLVIDPAYIKDHSEFKIMNRPTNRLDAFDKVTGKAKYTADIQLPGMLYARVLRPLAHGTKLLDADLTQVQAMKDVLVIKEADMIAVLHKYPDVAESALEKIKAKFSKNESNIDDKNIFDHLLNIAPPPETIENWGNLSKGREQSQAVFNQTYLDGYVAHATIETHAAVAKPDGNKVTVWASTQNPFGAKEKISKELGIPLENVRVITPYVGAGFGGKTHNTQAVEAARLAKRTGRPVQVMWTRQEEFFYDHYRPAAVVKINSGINDKGEISFWDCHAYFSGERGTRHYYKSPHQMTRVYGGWQGGHPFFTGAWRAPGNNTNTFARESQIDIMAAKAGIDPLEFRLKHVQDKRMRAVLEAAAKKFGWTRAKKFPSGRGWGIACGTDVGVPVATIVEAEVNSQSGHVQVKRMVCAQDMGLVINPSGATIQMEGCLTMGLGYALTEDIYFKNGEIFNRNFDNYEIPRFSSLPKIETIIFKNPSSPALGGGEPAIITVGGAVANAIYDAAGARVFQMPVTPERIKKALEENRKVLSEA